ncbi:MAG: group I intron-associated PD-(D/E)XK endonuclease [Saprospiraceae bacterium]
MNTKLKGDIAEQAIILKSLLKGWGVSRPVGDRLSYDLILDVNNSLVKVQVKSAWFDCNKENYVVDVRRTNTNKRKMTRTLYSGSDFDFAIIYLQEIDVCYVMPNSVFTSYGSEIHFSETTRRQRKPKSWIYREAWDLILHWAVSEEIPK